MNFLKRLFPGRDSKFYDLLESSAAEAHRSAQILKALMPKIGEEQATHETIELLTQSRRKHKRITQEITNSLCHTFVTPLEREDIEMLSGALFRAAKTIEKIGERLLIYPIQGHTESMVKHVTMLEKATTIVDTMVDALRKRPHVEDIDDEYAQLQALEGEADHFLTARLKELFREPIDAKDALFLKDMYELLEEGIDLCRDAGNIIFQIVLKYS